VAGQGRGCAGTARWRKCLIDAGDSRSACVPEGDLDDGEASLTKSFMNATGRYASSVFGRGIVGSVATLGAVAAGLLIGGAAVLVPHLFPRDLLSGLGDRLRRSARSPVPVPSAPTARYPEAPAPGDPESFDTWHAVVKTFTYRVMVTTVDFGANYFVIGELATAAGLSSLSLIAGPVAYFAHEAAWHYYGPTSTRHPNPLEATVHVPIPAAAAGEENGRTPIAGVKVSRAFAKTVTYEVVTGVSEFGVNYLFVRDLAAAAGSRVIGRSAASAPHRAEPNPALGEPTRRPPVAARATVSASLRARLDYEDPSALRHCSGAPNRTEFADLSRRIVQPPHAICLPKPTPRPTCDGQHRLLRSASPRGEAPPLYNRHA
jgi:uncharacterized membrane protein